MQTIETVFLPISNMGNRIKAKASAGASIIIRVDTNKDCETNHKLACIALCKKVGWDYPLVGGHTRKGMVWVFELASCDRISEFDLKGGK